MTSKFEDENGHLYYHLICPVCGEEGDVLYSKRKPEYCSNACRQKAYRERKKKRNNKPVTKLTREWDREFRSEHLTAVLRAFYMIYGYDATIDAQHIAEDAYNIAKERYNPREKRF